MTQSDLAPSRSGFKEGPSRSSGHPAFRLGLGRFNGAAKRVLDITLSGILLLAAAPLMAVIAVLIRLDSPGEVFFAQERLGLRRRRFLLYKFRKFPMTCGDAGPGVTVRGDARMTRLGAILERTKFDELPQLWNVLRGDMSLVGPRPEIPRFADLFQGEFDRVLDYVPGIFGPCQVVFRNESSLYPSDEVPEEFYRRELFPRKARTDLEYFGRANCLRDLLWIVRGLFTSVAGVWDWRRFLRIQSSRVAVDLAAVASAWTLANLIRFMGLPEGMDFQGFLTGLWALPLVMVGGLMLGGCYRRPSRCFSMEDAIHLTKATAFVWLTGFLLMLGVADRTLSLSLLVLGGLLVLVFLAAPRVWTRLQATRNGAREGAEGRKVIIYGTGGGGRALARWLKQAAPDAEMIGFLDDNPDLTGNIIQGCPVLGQERDLPLLLQLHGFDEMWLTFVPDDSKRVRIGALSERLGFRTHVLPEIEPFRGAAAPVKSRKGPSSSADGSMQAANG